MYLDVCSRTLSLDDKASERKAAGALKTESMTKDNLDTEHPFQTRNSSSEGFSNAINSSCKSSLINTIKIKESSDDNSKMLSDNNPRKGIKSLNNDNNLLKNPEDCMEDVESIITCPGKSNDDTADDQNETNSKTNLGSDHNKAGSNDDSLAAKGGNQGKLAEESLCHPEPWSQAVGKKKLRAFHMPMFMRKKAISNNYFNSIFSQYSLC